MCGEDDVKSGIIGISNCLSGLLLEVGREGENVW